MIGNKNKVARGLYFRYLK